MVPLSCSPFQAEDPAPVSSTRLTLIRHGHTASNGGGLRLLSGRTDVPLSSRGRAELEQLRDRLRDTPPFAAIYSSPLRRARDTAAALVEIGLGPLRLCPGLAEIDCGLLEGMPLEEVRARYPELWQANLRQSDDRFRWPGGESYRQFRRRCLLAVRGLARAHAGQRIALVTHAGVIGQVLGSLEGRSPAEWEPFRPGNTGITEVEWSRRRARILRFDDRRHLLEAG